MTKYNLMNSHSFSETHFSIYPAPTAANLVEGGIGGGTGRGDWCNMQLIAAYDMEVRTG